ncbi:hypothetical protein [Virgibacillus salexigens]|uniref:hypothetical protein n=1 Tax=Virgibacillus salexigens TaxID=61016 RepID=UPI00190BDBDC|nr:hypothetical protein [Virgibacillus salexigens]
MNKDLEDKIWEKWLVDYSRMGEGDFISFDEYKDRHFKKENKQQKSDEEILNDAENILKLMSQK